MNVLELRGVTKQFGALVAIDNVTFAVSAGERIGLIGPNGAGKSTLFSLISGHVTPTAGTIRLGGRDVTGHPPEKIATYGLGRTFQRNSLFLESTVYENVRLVVQRRLGIHYQMLRSVEKYPELRRETEQLLERVQLRERTNARVADLSYGEQRQVELALALATMPKVLLLDEPTAGMSVKETMDMARMLAALPEDVTLLIVEHDMEVVQALAQRLIVLNFGKLLADGPIEEVRQNSEVLAAYLGSAHGQEAEHA